MSFSSSVKEYLCNKTLEEAGFFEFDHKKLKDCCAGAFLAPLILFSGIETGGDYTVKSDNSLYLETAGFLLIEYFNIESDVYLGNNTRGEKYIFTIKATKNELKQALFKTEGHFNIQDTFLCPQCSKFFLRSAFLSHGTILDPARGYHCELCCESKKECEILALLICDSGIEIKFIQRDSRWILYLKSSVKIEDFLALIGAQKFSFELMSKKIEKSIINDINRRSNFEEANLNKSIGSAQNTLSAIKKLREQGRFDKLPLPLKKAAMLREAYPEVSLAELCSYSDEPISKSGLNHRYKKIIQKAECNDEDE